MVAGAPGRLSCPQIPSQTGRVPLRPGFEEALPWPQPLHISPKAFRRGGVLGSRADICHGWEHLKMAFVDCLG